MTNQMSTEVRSFNDVIINQRQDGYLDATAMCKACGKRMNNWTRLDSTKEFLNELSSDTHLSVTEIIQSVTGGNPQNQGTWVHPDVAISLAQWLSPKFAVQVSKWVRELMTTGKVDITQPKLPTDYITALEALVVSEKEKEALRLENQSQATKIEVDRPKVDFYHQLFSENPLVSFNDYAKLLSKETGVKIGQNNLMKFLRESGYLMVGRAGSKSNERNKAYQKYITAGYFEIEYNKTPVGLKPQTFITAKGQIELAEMIVNHFTK